MKAQGHMRKRNRIVGWRLVGAVGAALASSAVQAQILSVDMDPLTAGIQNTLTAAAGQNISVDVVLLPGAAGVSSYSVSVQFDNTELSHTGAIEPLPAGYAFNLLAGTGLTPNVVPGVDELSSFDAGTFGAGPAGPPPFVIGTINFTVGVPANDGLPDVTPGFFLGGIDAMFDNAGAAVAPVINPGFLVPEPGVIYGAALLLGFAAFRGYRRSRKA